eukprot:TRINITY_DN3959_c0_g1_i1.p1 TRINITY_DN3959_c0_g1~~TRINITY_DN3959_c0_g1_i1.p1  ORF type:complete len:198 (-),score=62.67 TRINITY_DN3959_c0_g1_i1:41-634(-)
MNNRVPLLSIASVLTETSNNNILTLLGSELIEKNSNTHMTKEEFNNFLTRFGPIDQVITKMNDFINSGANDWYHGDICRKTAENILKEALKTKSSAYLFRAKSSSEQQVAFVLSFGFSNPQGSTPEIKHSLIFSIKNRLVTVINEAGQKEKNINIPSVIGMLKLLNPEPLIPVPSEKFRFCLNYVQPTVVEYENLNI